MAVFPTDDLDALDVDDSSVHHRPSCEWRRENLFAPWDVACDRPSVISDGVSRKTSMP